jgi:hypothetical protein
MKGDIMSEESNAVKKVEELTNYIGDLHKEAKDGSDLLKATQEELHMLKCRDASAWEQFHRQAKLLTKYKTALEKIAGSGMSMYLSTGDMAGDMKKIAATALGDKE